METLRGARVIPIIGMHRSGTSALAGAMHKLGADLGPSSSWIQPASDNPRGFFEYAPVVDLDRDLLAALGGSWSNPPPLPSGWTGDSRIADLRIRAERLASELPERMVMKDPRLSLLLPLWQEVARVPATILCLRHPVSVANSLIARDEFTLEQGLFLWFRYNSAALINSPEALVVEYESLLTQPGRELERVAQHLGLEVSPETLEGASDRVYRSMAHHDGETLPDSAIGQLCDDLYDLLRSGDALEGKPNLSRWAQIVGELPWVGPGDREIGRLRGELENVRQENKRLIADNDRLEQRARRLAAELGRAMEMVDMVTLKETTDLLRSLNTDTQ